MDLAAKKSTRAAAGATRKRAPKAKQNPARDLAMDVAEAAMDKKALNVEIIEVAGKVDYADYVVVMSATSDRHANALAKTKGDVSGDKFAAGQLLVFRPTDRITIKATQPARFAVIERVVGRVPAARQGPVDPRDAAGVALLGGHRLLRDDADVGVGGEVDDRVAVLHRRLQRLDVQQIADHGLDGAGLVMGRVLKVVVQRLVAGVGQLVDHVAADESGAARDEDAAHARSSATTAWVSASSAGA